MEAALQRARARNQHDRETHGTDENRFEAEGEAFYRRVHSAYAAIAQREPARVQTIGDGDIETIAARVRAVVLERFPALIERPASV